MSLRVCDTTPDDRSSSLLRSKMSAGNLIAESVPLYLLAIGVILLRCYVRSRVIKSFGNDDWAMLGTGVRIVGLKHSQSNTLTH